MTAGERGIRPDMLTDDNPNSVLSTTRDGRVIYRNQAARAALAGQGYTVTVPDEWLPVLDKALESGQVVEIEWHAGARTYACKFMLADGGERVNIYCTDITAYKQTTRALRESEARYRTVIAALPEGIILQDRDGIIRASNASAERILGLTLDQMMARAPLDPRWRIIREDGSLAPSYSQLAAITLRTALPQVNEIMGVVRPDNTLTWVSVNTEPVFMPGEDEPYAVVISLFDITEQKLDEAAVRGSEARLRAIVETAAEGIITLDEQGTIESYNRAAARIFGYSPDEVVGRSVSALMPDLQQAWREGLPDEIAPAGRQGESGQGRGTVGQHKDGRAIPLHVSVVEVWLDEQRLFTAFVRDTSESARAEDALRRSEEQLRSLIASLEDQVLSVDLEGRLLVYHSGADIAHDTPITPAEALVGKSFREVLPPELAGPLARALDRVAATLQTDQFEYNLVVDRQRHYYSGRVSPLISPQIELIGFTVVVSDITESVHARQRQQHLLAVEQLNRAIAASFLRSDDPDQTVNRALKLLGEFFNVSRAYVVRYRADERVMDSTHEWCGPGVASLLHSRQYIPYDHIMPSWSPVLHQQGIIAAQDVGELPADIQAFFLSQGVASALILPIYTKTRIEGFVGLEEVSGPRAWQPEQIAALRTITDGYARILERQQTEREIMRARDEALRLVHLKNRFVSNISHEIRTPMTGLLGMLELLLESPLAEEQSLFAQDAYQSAVNLLKLLDNVLDFSRLEAGRVELDASPLDVRGLLAEIKDRFMSQVLHKRLDLITFVDEGVPARVVGDPARLLQALIHLVENAIKFTREGEVTVAVQQVSATDTHCRLRFQVNDTGIGIQKGQIGRLFDGFVQGESVGTHARGGTGLGLAISRQLVQLMGGDLEVYSEPGQGSTFEFTLTLPIAGREEQAGGSPSADAPANVPLANRSPDGARILVADDDAITRQLAERVLAQSGYEVAVATNGREVLDRLSRDLYGLVLMDIAMPGMDGLATTRHIRALEGPNRDVPILAVTGLSDEETHRRIAAAGIDAVLVKPIALDALRAAVRRWARSGSGAGNGAQYSVA